MASLNNFSRLWDIGTVPGCGTWPWNEEECPGFERPWEEGVGVPAVDAVDGLV